MMSTPYEVPFRVDKENQKLCSKTLDGAALKKFRHAVKDDYYFQARRLPLAPFDVCFLFTDAPSSLSAPADVLR